jgi:hypothetical protein
MSYLQKIDIEPFVFIHIPKTAGTSCINALEQRLTKKLVVKDYGIDSLQTSPIVKNTVYNDKKFLLLEEIIRGQFKFFTGHFHAFKYLDIFNSRVKWCNFIREPIQRVISEYYHLQRNNIYCGSLEEFCSQSVNCNCQSKLIPPLKLEDFYLVGITEHYQDSLELFNHLTKLALPCLQANISKVNLSDRYQIDPTLLKKLHNNNLQDLELYEQANKLLRSRLVQL